MSSTPTEKSEPPEEHDPPQWSKQLAALQPKGMAVVRGAIDRTTGSRAGEFKFAVGVLLGTAASFIILPWLNLTIPVAFFTVVLPMTIALGLLATKIPTEDIVTTREALALERTDDILRRKLAVLHTEQAELERAGLSKAAIERRLAPTRETIFRDHRSRLSAIFEGDRPPQVDDPRRPPVAEVQHQLDGKLRGATVHAKGRALARDVDAEPLPERPEEGATQSLTGASQAQPLGPP